MSERKTHRYSIELCTQCEGKAFHERDELTDYHRREYDTIRSPCKHCNAVGRVAVEVVTTYRPLTEQELKTEGRW